MDGDANAAQSGVSELQSQDGPAQADSANYAQTSPRIPRSQISRAAHAAVQFGALAEGTSAVLSGQSADDETALSAAEVAGEHTSQPPPQQHQELQPLAAPVATKQQHSNEVVGDEVAGSPPGSVSPICRVNSLVSHTAPELRARRLPGDTPISAPPLGASPCTSKVEPSAVLQPPRSMRRPGYSAGAPAGLPRVHTHTPSRPAGPSQPSLSLTQGCGPLPSTLAVAVGASPSVGMALPATALPPAATPLGGLSAVGQHMLGSPLVQPLATALMPPPAGAGGAQLPQAALAGEYGQGPPLTPQLLHAPAASAVLPGAQLAQLAALAQMAAVQAATSAPPMGDANHVGAGAGSEAPQASQGAASVLSLFGNSVVQGHALPLPVHSVPHLTEAALAAALQSAAAVGAATAAAAAAAAAVAAAGSPEPQQAGSRSMTPRQAGDPWQPLSEPRREQPANSRVVAAPQSQGGPHAWDAPLPGEQHLGAHAAQAASIVEGRHSPVLGLHLEREDAAQARPLPRAEPQAAVIQEMTVAEVMAASQEGPLGAAAARRRHSVGGEHSTEGGLRAADMEADDAAQEVQQAAAPAAHGAASVMAAVVTHSGRSEGDTDVQQTASGPSQPAGARRSPSPSAQPAVATAHTRSMLTAATQPSQRGPAASERAARAQRAPSSLATVSTGNGERPGGSVGMVAPHHERGAATSAPPASNSLLAAAMAAANGVAQPAASAPAAAPAQQQRAPSPSVSGQGDHQAPGALANFAEHNPAAVALSACEGQNVVPAGTGAKSRRKGTAHAAQQAPASPEASMHVAGPRGSDGTARGTIVAGAACSILTTAAAGDAEGVEDGGEALSPLLAVKAAALAAAAKAAANTGTVLATGAVSGSVDGQRLGISAPRTKSRTGRAAVAAGGGALPSTLGVDADLAGSPMALASGQPSLQPARASVAVQQDDGTEVQQEVAPHANGHAAHAHSMVGNGHASGSGAGANMDLELTSPSAMVTHDSTAHSGRKHGTKRQRVGSSTPAPAPASSCHALS